MQYSKLEGIIINRRSYSDADRFYTILTRELGKISVFAKSVRSLKSKRTSSLDLFNKIDFELVERGDRRTLTHVNLINSFQSDKKHLSNISRLFQIGELVDILMEEDDPQEEVYDLLDKALTHLTRFESGEYLLRFKKRLLDYLGFWNSDIADQDIDRYIESLVNKNLKSGKILV